MGRVRAEVDSELGPRLLGDSLHSLGREVGAQLHGSGQEARGRALTQALPSGIEKGRGVARRGRRLG